LLAWFLTNIYRLDEVSVDDAICDEGGDKGIDGIYIHSNNQIDILQAKLGEKKDKQIGESSLRPIIGTVSQFKDANSVRHLIKTTQSEALKKLLLRLDIAGKLE